MNKETIQSLKTFQSIKNEMKQYDLSIQNKRQEMIRLQKEIDIVNDKKSQLEETLIYLTIDLESTLKDLTKEELITLLLK